MHWIYNFRCNPLQVTLGHCIVIACDTRGGVYRNRLQHTATILLRLQLNAILNAITITHHKPHTANNAEYERTLTLARKCLYQCSLDVVNDQKVVWEGVVC